MDVGFGAEFIGSVDYGSAFLLGVGSRITVEFLLLHRKNMTAEQLEQRRSRQQARIDFGTRFFDAP